MTTPIQGWDEITESQASKYLTHNTALRSIETEVILKVASTSAGMSTADGKTDLFTVPTSYAFVPTHAVIRNPTVSLATASNYQMGDGSSADTWKTSIDPSAMTSTNQCIVVTQTSAFTVFDAGDVFGIKAITGTSSTGTATVDLFGYLWAT